MCVIYLSAHFLPFSVDLPKKFRGACIFHTYTSFGRCNLHETIRNCAHSYSYPSPAQSVSYVNSCMIQPIYLAYASAYLNEVSVYVY